MYPSIVYNVHVYVELVLNMSKRHLSFLQLSISDPVQESHRSEPHP